MNTKALNLFGVSVMVILLLVYIIRDSTMNTHHFDYFTQTGKPSSTFFKQAYDVCYSTPRPNHDDDCDGYNMWVDMANKCGDKVLEECMGHYNEDECPLRLPWLKSRCF